MCNISMSVHAESLLKSCMSVMHFGNHIDPSFSLQKKENNYKWYCRSKTEDIGMFCQMWTERNNPQISLAHILCTVEHGKQTKWLNQEIFPILEKNRKVMKNFRAATCQERCDRSMFSTVKRLLWWFWRECCLIFFWCRILAESFRNGLNDFTW